MKTLHKLSALTFLSLTFCLPAFSQEKPKTIPPKETEAKKAATIDHFMMVDGRVVVMKDNEAKNMTKEKTLADGTKVMPDGTVVAKDGTKTMLKEGESLGMDGKTMVKDHFLMKGGKMIAMVGGKAITMTKEMVIDNGAKILVDGTVMAKDGTKRILKEGQMLFTDGKVLVVPSLKPNRP